MDDHSATKDLADPILLSKIDKFFELGIGEYIALPQVSNPWGSSQNIDH